MSCLLFIKNEAQLRFVTERLPELSQPNVLALTTCPDVWFDLSSTNKSKVIWAGDFVGGDDWMKIEDEALSLRDGWYRPIEQSLVYEGINLAELIRLEHTHFFRQAVRARIILERVFNTYAVSDVILVGRSETPCRDRHRDNNKNGVFEGVLLWEAYKRGITVKQIPFETPSPESKSPKPENMSGVGERIFAFDCWKDENSSKLIAVGSSFHLIILEPFVRAWSEQPGCEGLLLNLGKSIEQRNGRAGFRLPEDTRFASLADVSTCNQSTEYVQMQRRLLDVFNQWEKSRSRLDSTDILKNPYLNFHWTSIWNSLKRLPSSVQKAFEALRIMRPDVVLTDEMASSSIRVFTEVAKKKGILTVDCPHGYVGDIEEFQPHGDLYLAWGRETVRQLAQRFKIDSAPIIVTGSPVNEKVIKSKSHTEKRQLYEKTGLSPNKKTVCVVTRSIFANVWPVNIKEFFARCDEIASLALNQDIQIIIKVSPRVDHVRLYKRIFGACKNIYVCSEYTLDELLPVIDIGIMFFYVGTASLLFLHKGIPTIFIRSKNTVTFTDSAWQVFEDNEPLSKLCQRFLYDAEARRQRLTLQKQFAGQHLHIDDGDAAQRAALTIKDALKGSRKPIKRSRQRWDILTTQPPQTKPGQIGCLAIFAPHFGAVSETFITRQIDNLAPNRTVVVTREICEGVSPTVPCLVTPHSGGITVYHLEVEEQVVRFLAEHKVTHILCEYGCHGQSIVELNRRRLHLPIFVHFLGYDASKLLRNPEMVKYYKWMGTRVTGVIALSEKMKSRLVGIGIPSDKIRVIPHGVEIPPRIQAFPAKQPCRFVSVIRMVPKKAPLLLLRAFKKVRDCIPECTLDIIGDGPLRYDVERLIDSQKLNNAVTLHGYQPHEHAMAKLHDSCVYVQHSITVPETGDAEGLPHIILEASAAGLPIVSTLHEGIPDEVEHGVTGFLVKEGDVDGMADYMLKLAQNPHTRKTMGIAAHKKVAAEFNLPLWIQRLRAFLTSSDTYKQRSAGGYNDQFKELSRKLAERGWDRKLALYRKFFEHVDYLQQVAAPAISVIVVSWRLHPDTIKSLESLIRQRNEHFELVFVDNGAKPGEFDCLKPFIDTYVRLNQNTGAYLARNIGAVFAGGRVLLFLDDDGIAAADILRSYREAFDEYEAVAVRGSIWPKDRNAPPYTEHLYYGDRPFPYFSCQEGNTAYKASFFHTVSGWDDEIILGGAGLDLSRRLLDVEPDMRKQIYWPKAVLYHDRNDQQADWEHKKQIREASVERLKCKHPDYGIFQQCYKKYFQREDLLIHKDRWGLSEPDVRAAFEHSYYNQEPVRALQATHQGSTHSGQVPALNDRGETLLANGNIRGAMRCFVDAFRLNPADHNTVSNICRLYRHMGWTADAKALERRCLCREVSVSGMSENDTQPSNTMADYMTKLAQAPQMRRTMGAAAYEKIAAGFAMPVWMQRLRDCLTSSDTGRQVEPRALERLKQQVSKTVYGDVEVDTMRQTATATISQTSSISLFDAEPAEVVQAKEIIRAYYNKRISDVWAGVNHPVWFDHEIDGYLWPRNIFWVERGVFGRILMKPGCSVLDLCCGDGYYSDVWFSTIAGSIDACDNDVDALRIACQKHANPKINYHRIDILTDSFPKAKYDVITWFEGIEHFSEDHILHVLRKTDAALADDGILVGSTPLVDLPGAGKKSITNRQHDREFTSAQDLELVLKNVFADVQTWVSMHPQRTTCFFRTTKE